jgi:hypothetical protein
MSHSHRSLTLTIDAESEEDMAALLRQALYELNKHLPPPSDAPIEERNAYAAKRFSYQTSPDKKLVGHTSGSMGRYSFEFFKCSRLFYELEQQLISQGYVRDPLEDFDDWNHHLYVHSELPPKEIAGTPLSIIDRARRGRG